MKTTFMANPNTIERKWYVVDAEGKTLGRLAAEVAKVLRGKNKPTFTPHVDTGDHVIVVNAEKIRVTGKKLEQKEYFRHSGYPGGARFTKLAMMLEKQPKWVVIHNIDIVNSKQFMNIINNNYELVDEYSYDRLYKLKTQ